jgi:hypothetical protein
MYNNSCNKNLYEANERKTSASNKNNENSSLFNICREEMLADPLVD